MEETPKLESKGIKLTQDQIKAKKAILAFVEQVPKKEEDWFHALIGSAGTGKTTVTKAILNQVPKKTKIAVTAPTHKAKEVIQKMSGKPADTIQALLGMKPNVDLDNFNPNKPEFAMLKEPKLAYYDLIIIDEASMLNKSLFKSMQTAAIKAKTKLLLIGDGLQLPPVKEVRSLALEVHHKSELKEIVRQKDSNPMLKILDFCRTDMTLGTSSVVSYLTKNKIASNSEGEGYEVLPKDQFAFRTLEHFFNSEYEFNPNYVKVLAWDNPTVKAMNAYIRGNLIKSPELIAVGDTLTGYKTIIQENKLTGRYLTLVKNSVDYKVVNVTIVTKYINIALKFYMTTVKGGEAAMPILHPESYGDFAREHNRLLADAKRYKRWKPYYAFKEQIMLKEDLHDEQGYLICSKDIDYGYCSTVHKSQGSSYTYTCILLNTIIRNPVMLERKKLIYVALSRATKSNVILL